MKIWTANGNRLRSAVVGALLLFAASAASAQIPRHDVLECGLSDGSKFVLTSRYIWIPVNPNPFSVKTREPNEAYKIYYAPKGMLAGRIHLKGEAFGEMLESVEADPNLDQSRQKCSDFGLVNGVAFYRDELIDTAKHLRYRLADPGPAIPLPLADQTAQEKAIIQRLGVEPWGPFVTTLRPDGSIVTEQPLYDEKIKIIKAVYRGVSHDQGKTWGPPEASTEGEIFETGKSLDEQCFIARPIRINDTKLKPTFPPCPQKKQP